MIDYLTIIKFKNRKPRLEETNSRKKFVRNKLYFIRSKKKHKLFVKKLILEKDDVIIK